MKYRLAGATYRVIAEKLTEERAQAYAGEKSISFERAMKKIPHFSKRTAWDDVTAEMEDLQADGTTRVFLWLRLVAWRDRAKGHPPGDLQVATDGTRADAVRRALGPAVLAADDLDRGPSVRPFLRVLTGRRTLLISAPFSRGMMSVSQRHQTTGCRSRFNFQLSFAHLPENQKMYRPTACTYLSGCTT